MKIKYAQLIHQKAFHNDIESPQLFLTSGYGAGKSHALVMKTLKLSSLNKHIDGGMFCPSIPEYKRDILPIFHDILDSNNITYSYHQTDKVWQFPWTRGKIIVFTCEKRIRGPNLGYASVNEPGLITYERFKEILGRVRVKCKYPQVNLAGTPEGRSNWLYEHFIELQKGKVIYGDTRNNCFVSKDYVKSLEDNYDAITLQAYLEGKFISLTGRPFYYAFSREKTCDSSIKYDPNFEICIGMDFNVDFMTATLWQCDETRAHCFDEIVLPQNMSTQKMCDAIKARGYDPKRCIVYPDTAGKHRDTRGNISDMQILKNNGFERVKFKPRAPYFRSRQLSVNNMLDKGLIKINPKSCPTLLRDLEDVEQDQADYSKIKDNPKLTHASDGMDYMIDIRFPLSGKKPIEQFKR